MTQRWDLVDVQLRNLPRIPDPRGNLSFIEAGTHVPFVVGSVQWIYDVPGGEVFSGHACRTAHAFVVALSGSFEVIVDDGSSSTRFMLNRSYNGVHVPPGIWRSIENFSTNALCLVLLSEDLAEDDYIGDYTEFTAWRSR